MPRLHRIYGSTVTTLTFVFLTVAAGNANAADSSDLETTVSTRIRTHFRNSYNCQDKVYPNDEDHDLSQQDLNHEMGQSLVDTGLSGGPNTRPAECDTMDDLLTSIEDRRNRELPIKLPADLTLKLPNPPPTPPPPLPNNNPYIVKKDQLPLKTLGAKILDA